jgi:hypothetical protein
MKADKKSARKWGQLNPFRIQLGYRPYTDAADMIACATEGHPEHRSHLDACAARSAANA